MKSKTPEQIGIPKKGDYRYILRCSKCDTTFDLPAFTEKLTNEKLQQIVCPYCSEEGYAVVERPPKMFKINVEKKKKVSQDKMKRKKMELPFEEGKHRQ